MSREARSSDVAGSGTIRVTFQVPRDAANYLKQLSESRWPGLGELGIVDVQISDNSNVNCTTSDSARCTASASSSSTTLADWTGTSVSVDEHTAATKPPRTRRRGYKRRKKDKVVDDKSQDLKDINLTDIAIADNSQQLSYGGNQTSFDVNSFLRNKRESNFAGLPWPDQQNAQPSAARIVGQCGYHSDLYTNVLGPTYGGAQTHPTLNTTNFSQNSVPAVSAGSPVRLSAMSEVSPFLVNLLQNESYAQSEVHRRVRNDELPPPSTPFVPKRRKSRKRIGANNASSAELNCSSSAEAATVLKVEGKPFFKPSLNGSVNSIQLGIPIQYTEKPLENSTNAGTFSTTHILHHTDKYNIDFLEKNSTWSSEACKQFEPDKTNSVKSSVCGADAGYGVNRVPYSSSQTICSSSEVPCFPYFIQDVVSKETVCSAEFTPKSLTLPDIVRQSNYLWQTQTLPDKRFPVSSTVNTQCLTQASNHHLFASAPSSWSLAHSGLEPVMSSVQHNTGVSSVLQQKSELRQNQMLPSPGALGTGAIEGNKAAYNFLHNKKCNIEPAIAVLSGRDSLAMTSDLTTSIHGASSSVMDRMRSKLTDSVVLTSQSDVSNLTGSSLTPDDHHESVSSAVQMRHNGLRLADNIEHQLAKFSMTGHLTNYNASSVSKLSYQTTVAASSASYETLYAVTDAKNHRELALLASELYGAVQNCSIDNQFEFARKSGNEVINHFQSAQVNGTVATVKENDISEQIDVHSNVEEHSSIESANCRPCTDAERHSLIGDTGSEKLYANTLSESVNGSVVINGNVISIEKMECEDNGQKTERRMSCDSIGDDILLVTGSKQPMNDNFLKCHLDSRLTLVTSNKL